MISNANSIVQHVIQIKSGIIVNFNVSAESVAYVKKNKAEIVAHVFMRMLNI